MPGHVPGMLQGRTGSAEPAAGARLSPRAHLAGQPLRPDKVCIEAVFPSEKSHFSLTLKGFYSPCPFNGVIFNFFPFLHGKSFK